MPLNTSNGLNMILKKILGPCLFLMLLISNCLASTHDNHFLKKKHFPDKKIIGNYEQVTILDKNLTLNAKMDTGAGMSSLTAQEITKFRRNHQVWIRFKINLANGASYTIKKPLLRYTYILRRKDADDPTKLPPYTERPVIVLKLCMGHQKHKVLVNLTDRSEFQYPMILGKNTLKKFNVLVDVTQKYLSPPCSIN